MHCQCNDRSKIGCKTKSINTMREDIKRSTIWYYKNLRTSIYIRLILHMHLSGSYLETLNYIKPNATPALRLADYHIHHYYHIHNYLLLHRHDYWYSLVAQMVKSLPAMRET